jgi:hypothetical protein
MIPGNGARKVLDNLQVGDRCSTSLCGTSGYRNAEAKGKAIYSLKLERHNCSYLCIAQNKRNK